MLAIRNRSRGSTLGTRIRVARSLRDRLVGLLMTPELAKDTGLWITPCQSVHTLFMRYTIDVAFVDRESRVLSVSTLKPWRLSRWARKATGVIELPAGTLQATQTAVGDQLEFQEVR